MYQILKNHWVAGAGFMATALLAVVPVVYQDWPTGLLLIFLASPGYMLHQLEEHIDDRFRRFTNQKMFAGRDALTTANVILINVGYVWGINLIALYVARFLGEPWGLAAPYLMLVNATGHIGQAISSRSYNPGLATSVLIFLPLGITTLFVVPGSIVQHVLGFGIATGIHVVIIASVAARLKTLAMNIKQ